MKGISILLFSLMLTVGISAQVLTCYDIQYTEAADGYSPYNNQVVTVEGIVTAKVPTTSYYISDPAGGPWSGLLVYHRNSYSQVSIGDRVQLTGRVDEYKQADYWAYTLTELVDVSNVTVISSGNPLPPPAEISTSEIPFNNAISEKYEGVMVKFNNVQIKTVPDGYGQVKLADTSNVQAMLDDGFFYPGTYPVTFTLNEWWYQIVGLVDYHGSAGWKVNPRDINDMIRVDSVASASIKIETVTPPINEDVEVKVWTTKVKPEWNINGYTMTFTVDQSKALFQGVEIDGTMSTVDPAIDITGNVITLTYTSQDAFSALEEDNLLVKLIFQPISYGDIAMNLSSFIYSGAGGDTSINSLYGGRLIVKVTGNVAYLSIGAVTSTGPKSQNIFDPSMNEKLNIQYGTKTGFLARALIRIYDAQGRLVATPVHENITNPIGIQELNWSGRDSNMKLVPPGVYYCHIEIVNRTTGATERAVQPVVIKSRMK